MGTTSLLKPAPETRRNVKGRDAAPRPAPFYETATPQERAQAFREWAQSHAAETPVILDDRREILYEDRD